MDYQEARKLLHPDTTRDAIWKIADKQEAIKKINEACVIACDAIDELQEYKQLGTLEEVREEVERKQAKKIKIWNGQAMCPNCSKLFGNIHDIKKLIAWEMAYCKFCGQHIDWSEGE